MQKWYNKNTNKKEEFKLIGILTEKPSAKKNFIKAFGGESGSINGEQFVIVNALGHLYELKDPKAQVSEDLSKKYSSWDLDNLPWNHEEIQWKYSATSGSQPYLKEIKAKLSKCTEVVIATDLDPTGEGDLLAAEVIFGQKLDKKKITRMEFVDESSKSLIKAFNGRREVPDLSKDLNYQKALFRSKWDFMSMQFTRVASNVSPVRGVIRQGRLKSAMVHLVGEQLKVQESYEEIPFFQQKFTDENQVIYTNPKEEKYETEKEVPNKYKVSSVVIESKENKKTTPPKLVDLARLSSMLAPRGFSAAVVQATYQKMYQEEYLSYPRTEDKTITFEQFNEMLPLVDKIANVVSIDPKKLTRRKPRPTHVKNAGSHGANRPGIKTPKTLKDLERFGRAAIPIYTLLAKNFLAMFAEDYEYEHQKGYIKDYPEFKGIANIPKKLGWKEIFKTDDDEVPEESTVGLGKIGTPFVSQGFPPKPAYPTQGWLMKQLEKYSVGSGATRNSTFAEITSSKSKYPLMEANKGRLSMTTFGAISHQLLVGTKIGNVGTSEQVLNAMKEIGNGNTSLITSELKKIEDLVAHDLEVMRKNSKNIVLPEFTKKEKETTEKDGKEISFNKEWGGHKFTEEEIELLIEGKSITISNLKNKRGKKYSATGKLEEQKFKGKPFWGFKMKIYQEEGKDPVEFNK